MASSKRLGLLNLLEESADKTRSVATINEWDLEVSGAQAGLVVISGLSGSGRRIVAVTLAEALGCVDWESARAIRRFNEQDNGMHVEVALYENHPDKRAPRLHVGELRDADLETLQEIHQVIDRGGQVIAEVHAAGPEGVITSLGMIYSKEATRGAWSELLDLLQTRTDALLVGVSRRERGGPVYIKRRMLSELKKPPGRADHGGEPLVR